MKTNYWIVILVLSIASLACKKEKEEDLSSSEQTAKDQAVMESEMAVVYELSKDLALLDNYDDLSKEGPAYEGSLPKCANLQYNSSTRQLLVSFPATNCTGIDGLQRSGLFTIKFGNTPFNENGGAIDIEFGNYVVEGVRFTGTILIRNLGANGAYRISYKVINAKAITPTGTITWNSELIFQQTAGQSTATVFDDVFEVSGSSSGVNRRGISYTGNIETALKKKIQIGCARTFVKGTVRFEDSENNFVLLDYDPDKDEACDRKASLKINNRVAITFFTR